MAYFSRTPEGVFWTQRKARAYHICLGDMDCQGINPGETYWERRTRYNGRPTKFCLKCAEERKQEEGGSMMDDVNRDYSPQPFLKWAGGKRQLLPEIMNHVPEQFNTYYEPFLGGGAVLFALQPAKAVINDVNTELMNCYRVIRDSPDELIACLSQHKNEKEYFYRIRDMDLDAAYADLSPVEHAARIIYLNRTCFNGLFRVNNHGHFNVPFGRYANPQIVNEPVLRAVHEYLSKSEVEIRNTDFAKALHDAGPGDFVYIDPPYDPASSTASFTAYNAGGFVRDEQVRLKEVFDELTAKGCYVLLSNSATPFILDLYKEYTPVIITANRAINSNGNGRGRVQEILVSNAAFLQGYGENPALNQRSFNFA